MKKQVERKHYKFFDYISKRRWNSYWHQIDEVIKLNPSRVLEIGPGAGVFKTLLSLFNIKVETLDIDPELTPDYVGSVFQMPFDDREFDVVCAFQMLEHLPYNDSLKAFKEMARVAKKNIVISLPDAKKILVFSLLVPRLGLVKISLPIPRLRLKKHEFDGEHYWEVNKLGFSLETVINDLLFDDWVLTNSYRVPENPYHRFFIYTRTS